MRSVSVKERREIREAVGRLKPQHTAFDTPSLRHLALSAPYFHDGAVDTLEALIDHNGDRMGSTAALTAEERQALLAYLETL